MVTTAVFFMETWHAKKFSDEGIPEDFVQDNHSKSSQGILRGLHYQIKHAQGKLIRVINGEVYDVAVDLRASSSTFGQSVGYALSGENRKMIWIPPGFAHGFYVISRFVEIVYKCTDFYAPEYEKSLLWNDKELNINWPLVDGEPPVLSEKDASGQTFQDADYYP